MECLLLITILYLFVMEEKMKLDLYKNNHMVYYVFLIPVFMIVFYRVIYNSFLFFKSMIPSTTVSNTLC